jgi:hypothetical protein
MKKIQFQHPFLHPNEYSESVLWLCSRLIICQISRGIIFYLIYVNSRLRMFFYLFVYIQLDKKRNWCKNPEYLHKRTSLMHSWLRPSSKPMRKTKMVTTGFRHLFTFLLAFHSPRRCRIIQLNLLQI